VYPIETWTGRSLFFGRDLRDLESKYFQGEGGKGWAIGGRGLGGSNVERLLDLIPGASRSGSLRKHFMDPERYGSPGQVVAEEFLPWSTQDVNLEDQKARSIQSLLDPMLHGAVPGVRQMPRFLYMRPEEMAALRGTSPLDYYRMAMYKNATREAGAMSRERNRLEQLKAAHERLSQHPPLFE
jgi:hypothetical protein